MISFPTLQHQGFPKTLQVLACFTLSLRLNSFWIFTFKNRSIIRLRISSINQNAVPTEDTKEFCHTFWIMSTYFNVPSMAIETVNEIIYIMWRLSFLHEIFDVFFYWRFPYQQPLNRSHPQVGSPCSITLLGDYATELKSK